MIISHKHKYLFVELPRTGTTAIATELRQHYDGIPILHKHATYYDFLKIANDEEKKYFTFSTIRNPLSSAVSLYFKYKTNHRGQFTNESQLKKRNIVTRYFAIKGFNLVHNAHTDFSTYFMKMYKIPYDNWSSLSHKTFDFVLRFENLQDDFATVIDLLGLEQKRPLPVVNKTGKKKDDFLLYYTPDTIKRAKRVFGPFMAQWGYEFPPEWGNNTVPWWQQLEFQFYYIFRRFYWIYLRPYW